MSASRLATVSFNALGAAWIALVCGFMLLPLVVIVGASFGTDAFIKFPPTGLTLSWYRRMLELQGFAQPLWVSIRLGVIVAALSAIAGALAAYAMAGVPKLRRSGLQALFTLPIVLPSLVIGLALLVFFNLIGINNTWITLVFGHVAVTMPIVFQTSASLAATLDRNLEFAAMTLGARSTTVIVRIVLPLLRPAIVGGFIMAFALSFDEFVISILLANGGVTTFPVALFTYMRFSVNPTLAAISTALILGTCVVTYVFHQIVGLELLFGLRRGTR